ncbi:MAG: ComEC/Rec2 family competence protein [Patescibacteria group bacterium]
MRRLLTIAAGCLVTALLVFRETLPLQTPGSRVDFLDIGQGDAALVTLDRDWQILIDGGPDPSVLRKIGRIMPRLDRRIELVVLTHPHLDHYGGLVSVLERYEVPVLLVRQDSQEPAYQRLLKEARKNGTAVVPAAGQRLVIRGGSLHVLDPLSAEQPHLSNANDASVVVKLELHGTTFLFPGDAEEGQERRLLRAGGLGADFLKVGHHGSRTSSTAEFLESVRPSVCVVSVGAGNRHGHPAPEALDRLSEQGCRIARTDRHGTVSVLVAGRGVSVRTER